MTQDVYLHIRLDDPTKLRLQELASERGVTLSRFVRERLYELVRDPATVDPATLPAKEPTFAELRERALLRLLERFQAHWMVRDEADQLRWVKACLSEIPPLAHADPSRVLFELRSRSGISTWQEDGLPANGGTV